MPSTCDPIQKRLWLALNLKGLLIIKLSLQHRKYTASIVPTQGRNLPSSNLEIHWTSGESNCQVVSSRKCGKSSNLCWDKLAQPSYKLSAQMKPLGLPMQTPHPAQLTSINPPAPPRASGTSFVPWPAGI